MGRRNYLVEGVSGTGKSSVCRELRRRGHVAINGDRELAYRGDPTTGERVEGFAGEVEARHKHHIWDVEKVRSLATNQDDEDTFFCGGSRNFQQFIDLFDKIFILDIDAETLDRRLDSRTDDDWGKHHSERQFVLRLHATKDDVPGSGIVVDATQPLVEVVDEILRHVRAQGPGHAIQKTNSLIIENNKWECDNRRSSMREHHETARPDDEIDAICKRYP